MKAEINQSLILLFLSLIDLPKMYGNIYSVVVKTEVEYLSF